MHKVHVISLFIVSSLLVACSSTNPGDWNKRERGTAIGAASGAALGGIIGSQSGNTGAGVLLGGAAGAGAGHLLGREFDKDDDRRRR
jgi:uncharacterized protein YcfJ